MLKTSAEANGFSLEFKIKPNYLKQAIVIVFGSKMKKVCINQRTNARKLKRRLKNLTVHHRSLRTVIESWCEDTYGLVK